MKQTALSLLAAVLLIGTVAQAQNKAAKQVANKTPAKAEAWVPVDAATMEKAWMEYMTPTEAHKMLASADGEWVGEMTMWMEAGGEPMKTIVTADNKMVLGGRYQTVAYKGDFMGMPFEGQGTNGYDNAKKTYFSTWIDNMGTGLLTMEGTWNSATRSINFSGKSICPANGKLCDVREVYRIIDENTHVLEMYGPDMKTGKEYKNMEIRLTRKK